MGYGAVDSAATEEAAIRCCDRAAGVLDPARVTILGPDSEVQLLPVVVRAFMDGVHVPLPAGEVIRMQYSLE
jgi:hypothetical protein